MTDLRDHSQPCEHGWLIYHDHADVAVDCPGGREVTRREMIDRLFPVVRDRLGKLLPHVLHVAWHDATALFVDAAIGGDAVDYEVDTG